MFIPYFTLRVKNDWSNDEIVKGIMIKLNHKSRLSLGVKIFPSNILNNYE